MRCLGTVFDYLRADGPQSKAGTGRSREIPGRSGNVLVLVAMLLFGIMGFAALVIDIGYVRLTSRQMRQATDGAALEAVRFSDAQTSAPETYLGRTPPTETGRRQVAQDIVSSLFDDDFDLTDDERNFGAGPQVNLTGGIAMGDGFNASQDLSLPTLPVYKPALELNNANESDGDIVSEDDSVLVRLRRDNEVARAGELSNGGPIPYLFGRGTLLSLAHKAGGVPVTISTTADTQPVVRVGIQQTVGGVTMPGGIGFGMTRVVWESLSPTVPTTTALAGGNVGVTGTLHTEIGEAVSINATSFTGAGYCPIVENIGGTDRVIGFGWANVAPDPGDPSSVVITKFSDVNLALAVAAENATGRLSEAWTSLALLSDADRQAVISANQSFSDPLVSPVLTPGGGL